MDGGLAGGGRGYVCGGVVGGREQRLDAHEIVEGGALGVREVIEALGVEDGLALGGGKLAEAAEGAGDVAALVGGKVGELLHGVANLAALLGGEMLHGFVALEDLGTLFSGHGVELGEAIAHALLGGGREVTEAGLGFEGLLLLLGGEIVVAIDPVGEMLAGGPGVGAGVCRGGVGGLTLNGCGRGLLLVDRRRRRGRCGVVRLGVGTERCSSADEGGCEETCGTI